VNSTSFELSGTRAAAVQLVDAMRSGRTLPRLPHRLEPLTEAAGWAIQKVVPELMQGARAGWKIAATSAKGQQHIGVSAPLAGQLLLPGRYESGSRVSLAGNHMRVVEAEFGFVLGKDLAPGPSPASLDTLREAVDSLVPTLEIPNSRFERFEHIGAPSLWADNGCAHQWVEGIPISADCVSGLPQTQVTLKRTRGDDCVVHAGSGQAVLGDPWDALLWLVRKLHAWDITLYAGEIISTGSTTQPMPVEPGDRLDASFGDWGHVSVQLTA
jgi:2-keto-4-pentenoate hydratase